MSKTTKPSWQDNDALLTYRVGPVLCCGPTLNVISITPPPPLTQLPGTNIAEPGIFKHGSYIVSATDLRYRFGVKQDNWKQPGQVIIAQQGDVTRGYFVDEIKDVIHFPENGWGQLPSHLPKGIFSRTLLLDNHIYLYTDFEKLSQLQGSDYLTEYIAQLEINENKRTQAENIQKQTPSIVIKKVPISESNETVTQKNIPDPLDDGKPSIKGQSTNNIKTNIQTINKSEHNGKPPVKSGLNKSKQANSLVSPDINTNNSLPEKSTSKITPKIISSDTISTTTKNYTIKSKSNNSNLNSVSTDKIKQKPDLQTISNKKPKREINNAENRTLILNKNSHLHEKNITKPLSSVTKDNVPIRKSTTNVVNNASEATSSTHKKVEKILENSPESKIEKLNSEKSNAGIFFIFLIITMSMGGGYYYISQSTQKIYTSEQSLQKTNTSILDEHYENDKVEISTTTNEAAIIKSRDSSTKRSLNSTQSQSQSQSQNHKTLNGNINRETNSIEFHASIKQDSNTITIELDGPAPPEIKNMSEITSPVTGTSRTTTTFKAGAYNSEALKSDSLITEDSFQVLAKPAQNALNKSIMSSVDSRNNKSIEIIHTIVQGDTLWAIAKRYLRNPYRYPELAKLSKIRNPDLIYPGNLVRITYKSPNN